MLIYALKLNFSSSLNASARVGVPLHYWNKVKLMEKCKEIMKNQKRRIRPGVVGRGLLVGVPLLLHGHVRACGMLRQPATAAQEANVWVPGAPPLPMGPLAAPRPANGRWCAPARAVCQRAARLSSYPAARDCGTANRRAS